MARVIRADRRQSAFHRAAQPDADTNATRALARARYRAGWTDAQQPLHRTIARVLSVQETHLQALQGALIPLLTASLGRLLPRALEAEPALILEFARPLLQALRNAITIRVRAHPHDAAALRAELEARAAQAACFSGAGAGITITGDPALSRGSLWFESELGTIDGTLETRLCLVERALREATSHTRGHAAEST